MLRAIVTGLAGLLLLAGVAGGEWPGQPETCSPAGCQPPGIFSIDSLSQSNLSGSTASIYGGGSAELRGSVVETFNANFRVLESRLGRLQSELAALSESCSVSANAGSLSTEHRRHVDQLSQAVGVLAEHVGQVDVELKSFRAEISALRSQVESAGKDPLTVSAEQLAELRAAVLADLRASGELRAALGAEQLAKLRGPPGKDGKDGKDGQDGKDADPELLRELQTRVKALEEGVRQGPIYFDIVPKEKN